MKLAVYLLLLTCFFSLVMFASDEKKEAPVAKEEVKDQKAEVKAAGTQTLCPMDGKKVDLKVSVDYQGSRIKFCSATCQAKFLKAPEDGFKKIADAKEIVDSIQANCPVSGDVLEDFNKSADLPGRKIFFCCSDCAGDFTKDKESFLNKLPGVNLKEAAKEKAPEKK